MAASALVFLGRRAREGFGSVRALRSIPQSSWTLSATLFTVIIGCPRSFSIFTSSLLSPLTSVKILPIPLSQLYFVHSRHLRFFEPSD